MGRTFETNFFGVVALTQTLLPLIRKAPAGRIVNVSSILGSLTLHADPLSASGIFGFAANLEVQSGRFAREAIFCLPQANRVALRLSRNHPPRPAGRAAYNIE